MQAIEQVAVSQQEWVHREPRGVPGGQDFDVHANWMAIAGCVRHALQLAGADGADIDIVSIFEAVGQYQAGKLDQAGVHNVECEACPGAGSCGGGLRGGHFDRSGTAYLAGSVRGGRTGQIGGYQFAGGLHHYEWSR